MTCSAGTCEPSRVDLGGGRTARTLGDLAAHPSVSKDAIYDCPGAPLFGTFCLKIVRTDVGTKEKATRTPW